VFADGQMSEKGFDFRAVHLGRVAFVEKEDEASDPIDISFFSTDRVMFDPQGMTDLIQQFGRLAGHQVTSTGGASEILFYYRQVFK